MRDRYTKRFVLLVLGAVVSMLIGVLIGHSVRSPAQKALDSQPPPATQITAPVERSSLQGTVVARGTVAVGTPVSIGPVKSSTDLSIVTNVFVTSGQKVANGQKLIEVSGRPVFVLTGDIPGYRDLHVGDTGPDAKELNAALNALHLSAGNGSTFSASTSQALGRLYARNGYVPPTGGVFDRREVAFMSADTGTVSSVAAHTGRSALSANLMTLSSGSSSVTAHVTPDAARSIAVGNKAQLDFEGSGGQMDATVAKVTIGDQLSNTEVILQPSSVVPPASDGSDIKVSITQTQSMKGSLAVPVSAVYTQASGVTVVVVRKDGKNTEVPVHTGAVVGGMVTVAAVDAQHGLVLGDEVVVNGVQ